MRKIVTSVILIAIVVSSFWGCSKKDVTPPAQPKENVEVEAEKEPVTQEPQKDSRAKDKPEPAAEKPSSEPLSDDLYSFQIQMGDDVYKIPTSFKDFEAFGWKYDGDKAEKIPAGRTALSLVFKNSESTIYANVSNFDVNERPVEECYISQIEVSQFFTDKFEGKIIISGGLEFDVATADDAIAKYGEPSSIYESSNGIAKTFTYEKDFNQSVKLTFDENKQKEVVLTSIKIENNVPSDDFDASSVSSDTPGAVGQYKAPTSLSANFDDYIVEFDSNLYQLPAPLSKFLDNGFVFKDSTSESLALSGSDFGRVELVKDNQTISVKIFNYSEDATTLSNCFVTGIISGSYDMQFMLRTAKGIEIGTDQPTLLKALDGLDYKTDETSGYTAYSVESASNGFERNHTFFVNSKTQKVYKITVDNAVKYSEFTAK